VVSTALQAQSPESKPKEKGEKNDGRRKGGKESEDKVIVNIS
jgi:hypothetical protein